MKRFIIGCMALSILVACTKATKASKENERVATVLPQQVDEVTVMTLARGDFHHELVSNGKVVAKEYADLYFHTSEVVRKVWVKNGTRVSKGQKLAELDIFRLNNTLAQRKNALSQATIELQDVLIGQGYTPEDLTAIPSDVMELAKVKSSYEQARIQYESALHDVEQATLTAPYDGVVANLFDKTHNMARSGEPFCRVIGTATMEVDFTVLESELPLIKIGDEVMVTPYASTVEIRGGHISEINPMVDANGMVRVKATVESSDGLFDGMNVRVSVKRIIPEQLVIPKTAIVLRSGKQVLFTVEDSLALWNYVKTGLENLTQYTLIEDEENKLQEGMTVIITGNVNLAHETKVEIIEEYD